MNAIEAKLGAIEKKKFSSADFLFLILMAIQKNDADKN